MIRKYTSLMAILALGFMASTASALDMVQTNPGDAVTIDVTTAVPGGTDVTFQPSSNVKIDGATETTSFAVIGGHDAVRGKEAGQNYGMSADSSNVFWLAAAATFPSFAATNSTYFNTNSWNRN